MSTYAVSCSLSKANPGRGIVRLASRSQESFLLRGGGKAREEKRRRASGGDRGGSERRALASPVTCSPTLIHLFGGSGAQPAMRIPDRPPTSCVGRPGSYMGRASRIVPHIRALSRIRRNSDSHNWRRHLSGRVVLSRYGPAKIYALCNCAIRPSTRPRCNV